MSTQTDVRPRVPLSVPAIRAHKRRAGHDPLVMLTAYDAPTARLAEEAGVDLLLVGDSVGTALLGYASTVSVTLEDILHHLGAVRRGAPATHVVADLPFMTYEASDEQAVRSAGRLVQGGADAVKLEAGGALASRIRAIATAGIPVVGHVGLTPQRAGALGGYRLQGRDLAGARAIVEDARAVAAAGVYALVIEVVPRDLGALITDLVEIPTIGIGAGADCDGQVLVWTDLLGLDERFAPKFARRYADLAGLMRGAFAEWAADVRAGRYPALDQTYAMKPEIAAGLRDAIASGDDQ